MQSLLVLFCADHLKNLVVIWGEWDSPKSGIKIPFQGVAKLTSQTEKERDRVQAMDTEKDRVNQRGRIFSNVIFTQGKERKVRIQAQLPS